MSTDPKTGGSRPVPDPTLLTTEALMREVASLEKLLELRIHSEAEARKVDIAAEIIARLAQGETMQSHIDLQMDIRKEKFEAIAQRFDAVEQRFRQNERQRVEQKDDVKAAVDAALSAQKEAVKEQTAASGLSIAKSENATNEQIKQLNATFTIAINGVQSTIDDAKERIGKTENQLAAIQGAGKGKEQSWGVLVGAIGGISGIIGIIIAIIVLVAK